MTRADFYILGEPEPTAREQFACRLTQKAFRNGLSVYIAVDNAEQASRVSEALWSFQPESFIPHCLSSTSETETSVRVGFEGNCGDYHGLLINLKQQVPIYFSQFERLAEVVCQENEILAATREHYNFYRHRGYPLTTHDLRKS